MFRSSRNKNTTCKKCDTCLNYHFLNKDKLFEHITQCYSQDIQTQQSLGKIFCKYCQVFVKDIEKHYLTMKHKLAKKKIDEEIEYINLEEKEWYYKNPNNGILIKLSNFDNYEYLLQEIKKNLKKKIFYEQILFYVDINTKKKFFTIKMNFLETKDFLLVDKDSSEKEYENHVIEKIFSKLIYEEITEIKNILEYKSKKIPKIVIIPIIPTSLFLLNNKYPILKKKYENIINFYKEFKLKDYSIENFEFIYNWKQNLIFEDNFRLQCLTTDSINRKYVFHGFNKNENFQNIIENGYIESNNLDKDSHHLLLGKGAYFAVNPKYSIENGFCNVIFNCKEYCIIELLVCEIFYDLSMLDKSKNNSQKNLYDVKVNDVNSIFCVRNNINQQIVAKLQIKIQKDDCKLLETITLPILTEDLLIEENNYSNNKKNIFTILDQNIEKECSICLDDKADVKLYNCKGEHYFHKKCIKKWFKNKKTCPVCKETYTEKVIGHLPNGKMKIWEDDFTLPGFPHGTKTYHIIYIIENGIQLSIHDNPGECFTGGIREAYLPVNPDGKDCLLLLKKAFKQRLTFIIGESLTTKQKNTICWNIHHKTSILRNNTYGYPDVTYRVRLFEELEQYKISLF